MMRRGKAVRLRSNPNYNLRGCEVVEMIKQKNLVDLIFNKSGEGVRHAYQSIERNGIKLIIDRTTGLTWQQEGSHEVLDYNQAQDYVCALNGHNYAGYNDWRLPTLEEALSLVETKNKSNRLHIDSLFDNKIRWIRTTDKAGSGLTWVVDFNSGSCYGYGENDRLYVRAVR